MSSISELIGEIVALLVQYGETTFVPALEAGQYAFSAPMDDADAGDSAEGAGVSATPAQRQAADELLALYGGMGSFSDIVLSSGGKMAVEDNRTLAHLRSDLRRRLNDLRTA